ncbi:MAG TPA: hypothetical protein VF473_04375 [Cyclobacteriaceae bacterium]
MCFDGVVAVGRLVQQVEAEKIDSNAPKVFAKFFDEITKTERPFWSTVHAQHHVAFTFVDIMLCVSLVSIHFESKGEEFFIDPGGLYWHAT